MRRPKGFRNGIYEFVANAVIDGLMRVMLDTDVPVFSSVLTPQQFHEHDTHADFFGRHLEQKGTEVAQAVLRALEGLHRRLPCIYRRLRDPEDAANLSDRCAGGLRLGGMARDRRPLRDGLARGRSQGV